jgi:predicted N-acyltransferase
MSDAETTFGRSIREFAEDDWDLVAGSELMMSHRWHRVMEACRRDYRPRYALIADERGPLAVAASAASSPIASPGGWRDRLVSSLTLTFGAPFSAAASGVSVRADTTLTDALPIIEPALRELCWRERRVLLGLTNIKSDELLAVRQRGFVTVPRPPTMVLDLESAAYKAYLSGLRKDDRAELRRARRRAEEHGVVLQSRPVDAASQGLFPLFAEVCARHGIAPDKVPISDELFPALCREMPDDAFVISGFVHDQPAGFVLCFGQRDTLLAPMVGLRYDLSLPSCLYAVLIDEIVRVGLQRSVKRIYLGIGNERQKQRHGFVAQARWACIRTSLGPFNFALEAAARLSAAPGI